MYQAKHYGRNGWRRFDPAIRDQTLRRLDLVRELEREHYDEQFELAQQPIVALGSERVIGHEALLRWQHPEHGRISPGQFVPLAEENGSILPLGHWVIEQACAQLARDGEKAEPASSTRLAINVCRKQLLSPGFVEQLQATLAAHGVTQHRLILEVTESTVVDGREDVLPVLHQLNELGFTLAMDDFGTGYSSLSCLHQYPISIVKLDRSFVAHGPTHPPVKAVLHTVTSMARELNMQIVAEGVETRAQAALLKDLGCDYAQGFLFGRPSGR